MMLGRLKEMVMSCKDAQKFLLKYYDSDCAIIVTTKGITLVNTEMKAVDETEESQ